MALERGLGTLRALFSSVRKGEHMQSLTDQETALLAALVPPSVAQAWHQASTQPAACAAVCAHLHTALAAIMPLVPAPVRQRHVAAPERGKIAGMWAHGTVLCADLSGFTALSARLAANKRHGSEEVSALINGVFAALLDDVTRHGGEVIQFGGDALTAWWDASTVGLDHSMLAGSAALAMQAQMAHFRSVPTSQGVFPLQLRVAVDSGDVFVCEVGDDTHTQLVVTGHLLHDVVCAQAHAAPAQVIVGPAAWRALIEPHGTPVTAHLHQLQQLSAAPALPTVAGWRAQLAALVTDPCETTVHALLRRIHLLQGYVPRQLPQRFLGAGADDGEFRPVTVMFASFLDWTQLASLLDRAATGAISPATVGDVINAWYTRAHAVIERYGGWINKVDMANGGNRLMAVFGAPTAHEDDPVRATQAALAHRDDVRNIHAQTQPPFVQGEHTASDPHVRLGVAGGTVFAGLIGTPERHEYTVMGPTVNLASRLLDAAQHDEVLVDAATARTVAHAVTTTPVPPLVLKGFAHPVPVSQALHVGAGELRSSLSLIGREHELRIMHEQIEASLRAAGDGGGVVAVVGEAGIGKTRFADEVAQQLRAHRPHATLARITCQSYEHTVPYAMLARLFRDVIHVPETLSPAQQAGWLQQHLDETVPQWSRFAPLLGALLRIPIPPTPLTDALSPQQRRDRLHDLLSACCLSHPAPLVLVVDDWQHIDASSRAVFHQVADEVPGHAVLLMVVHRSLDHATDSGQALPRATVIDLPPLTDDESRLLVHALLDGEPPAEIAPAIKRSDGRPFFLEETVRFLVETGVLERVPGAGWRCTHNVDGSVPARIEQLIMARLDRLPDATRTCAQVGAVLGQRFAEHVLAAVVEPAPPLQPRLAELIAAAIVQQAQEPYAAYQFKQAVIRDVAYNSLLFVRRRELHARAAHTIETLFADAPETHGAVLAHHYLLADQPEQAFPLFVAAAQHAQARYANDEAVALYEQALATAGERTTTDTQRAAAMLAREQLGDVLALTGEYARARTHYEYLLALLDQDGDTCIQRAALQRKIGNTYEHQGDVEHALRWLEQANHTLGTPAGAQAALEHARVLNDIGWAYFRQDDLLAAQHHLAQALTHIEPFAAHQEHARILNRLGGVAWARGDTGAAQRYVEQSLALNQRSNNLVDQATALNNLCILANTQGRQREAIGYGTQALELNEQIGNRRAAAIAALNLGGAYVDADDHGNALVYLQRALAQTDAIHDQYHAMIALLSIGRVHLALADWQAAEHAIAASEGHAAELGSSEVQLACLVARGELALARSDVAAARAVYEQAAALATDPASEEWGRWQRLAALVAHGEGDGAAALALLAHNEALFRERQNIPDAERSRRLREHIAQQHLSNT